MFDIRIICDPTDTDRITAALNSTFDTGAVRRLPSRSSDRERLYITADHRPLPEPRPTPEEAYAKAPSIIREIGWTAQTAADRPFGTSMGREFWLRKAALLDRIALADEAEGHGGDAAEAAELAAGRLIGLDSPDTICDPRHYVRQQYARWAKHQ